MRWRKKTLKIAAIFAALTALCIGLMAAGTSVEGSTASENSKYIVWPDGDLAAAHGGDITFYNKTHKLAYVKIEGADWVYPINGTIVFNRTSDIVISTHRDLKGSVWICTYKGWNPLIKNDDVVYKTKRGYCYITSIKYGEVKIPASELPPGKYTLIVGLYDTSGVFKYDDPAHSVWIRTDNPDTFDRVEIFGYGPISTRPFAVVVE